MWRLQIKVFTGSTGQSGKLRKVQTLTQTLGSAGCLRWMQIISMQVAMTKITKGLFYTMMALHGQNRMSAQGRFILSQQPQKTMSTQGQKAETAEESSITTAQNGREFTTQTLTSMISGFLIQEKFML